jgi:alpha-tubulin suppressor-like RCC1 family protein
VRNVLNRGLPAFLSAVLLAAGVLSIHPSVAEGPVVLADASAAQQIVAWGDNTQGALANSTIVAATARRTPVQGLPSAVALAAGDATSFAADANGRLYAWGADNDNAMPFPHTADAFRSPVLVSEITDVRGVAAAFGQAGAAITNSGALYTWGHFRGDGEEAYDYHPYQVPLLPPVQAAAGNAHGWMVLGTDGSVWTWGANESGQLGDGTTTARYLPLPVAGLPPIVAIAAGAQFDAALASDGSVWTWGNNEAGQLGQGSTSSASQGSVPAQVPDLAAVTQLAAGYSSTIVLKSDHTVYGWGCGGLGTFQGSCGGSTCAVATPMHLPFDGATAIAAGGVTAVTMSDGTVETSGGGALSGAGTQCPFNDPTRCQYGYEGTAAAPIEVAGLKSPSLLSVGDDHVLAVADVVGLPGAAPQPNAVYEHLEPTDMHNGAFTLSWDSPVPQENVNVVISGYTIVLSGHYTRTDGSLSTYDPITVGPNVHSHTFHVPNGTLILAAAVTPLSATATFGGSYDSFYVGYPRPPAGVTVERVAPHQLKLSWPAADDNGTPLTQYDVYEDVPHAGTVSHVAATEPGTTSVVLTDGQSSPGGQTPPGTCSVNTNFSVFATNQYGRSKVSPASDVLAAVCEPSAPTNVTAAGGDGRATVNWKAPYDGDSAISGYKVYVDGVYSLAAGAAARSGTVTGLSNGHYVTVTVVAVNAIGPSQPSTSATAAVFPPLPSAAVNVRATASSSDTVVVSWDAPTDHPERVHDYSVQLAGSSQALATAMDGDTSTSVSGLNSNTSYRFVVTSHDLYGRSGPVSSPSNAVSPMGTAPAEPAPVGRFHSVAPTVVYTTGGHPLLAGTDRNVIIKALPTSASAAVLTAHAAGSTATGTLRIASPRAVHPADYLAFVRGQRTSGDVTVPLEARTAAGGMVRIHLSSGQANVSLDLVGYVTPDTSGDTYLPLAPAMAYTTGSQAMSTTDREVTLSGLPPGAEAARVAVHVITPTATGNLRLSAPGTAPAVSTLNYTAKATAVGEATVGVIDGKVRLHFSAGQARVSLDLLGYYAPTPSGSGFHPSIHLASAKTGSQPLVHGADRELVLAGVPAGSETATVSVTVTGASATGELRLSAAGTQPPTSSVTYAAGRASIGEAVVRVVNGRIRLHLSAGKASVNLDLVGYSKP